MAWGHWITTHPGRLPRTPNLPTLGGKGDGARIELTITDLKPNRPTMQQTAAKPGLDPLRSISIGGAAGHNLGQMAAALITLGNTAVLGYLPFLLGISLLTGTLTGFVSSLLFRAMAHIKLSTKE